LSILSLGFALYQLGSVLNPWAYRRNLAHRISPDGVPIPPARLRMAVAGSVEIPVFLDGGRLAVKSIILALQKIGIRTEDLRTVLDFGCGCGRVLRFWKDWPRIELHGTDCNAALASWCVKHLPFAQVATNRFNPPTNYADGRFDLVYALSIFTHLPEAAQLEWMREFRRIIRPGGLLLLTLHGSYYLPRLNEGEQRCFHAGGLVVRNRRVAGSNLCNTFHSEAYVRTRLAASGFDVIDFAPEGAQGNPRQDLWLLRCAS